MTLKSTREMFGIIDKFNWFGAGLFDSHDIDFLNHVKWDKEHIDRTALNIRDAFFGCEHIVEIRWQKDFDSFREQYTYPYRELGEHTTVIEMRGIYNPGTIFVSNAFGGDAVYAGTNNSADALMIALKYGYDMPSYTRTIELAMLNHLIEYGETTWFRRTVSLYGIDLKEFKEKYSEEILFALLEH